MGEINFVFWDESWNNEKPKPIKKPKKDKKPK